MAHCDRNVHITWMGLIRLPGSPIRVLRWVPPETFGPIAISPPSLNLDTSTLESILHIYKVDELAAPLTQIASCINEHKNKILKIKHTLK